jgi:hypothetical protein
MASLPARPYPAPSTTITLSPTILLLLSPPVWAKKCIDLRLTKFCPFPIRIPPPLESQRLIMINSMYDNVRNVEIAVHEQVSITLDKLVSSNVNGTHCLIMSRLNSDTPANPDINEGHRTSQGWRRPRGRPHTTWIQHVRAYIRLRTSTAWKRATDRLRWRMDATHTALYKGYAD